MRFPEKKVILVTGSNGQLGREFRKIAADQSEFEFLFTTKDTLDVASHLEIFQIFRKFRPDFCINCAAYTAVDKAESDEKIAFELNSNSITCLVNACQINDSKLIHFSSDYVYDSIQDRPLKETDECMPASVYAKSKRAGELVLINSDIDWICFRVSWLYSSYNNNFVKTMLRLGKERDELHVIADQFGTPTYARDLATDVMKIIQLNSSTPYRNFYNYSNAGSTNWAEFAIEIFRIAGISCRIIETSTEDYNAIAPRPRWSVMSKEKVEHLLESKMKNWKDSLSSCLQEILSN